MDYGELTAEAIKLRIRKEVPSRETGLPGEILRLGKMRQDQIGELTARLEESEADRAARLRQIVELTALLRESEADRAARLEVIRGAEENIKRLQALLDDCEERRRALEGAFAVRLARMVGLIRTRRCEKCGERAAGD